MSQRRQFTLDFRGGRLCTRCRTDSELAQDRVIFSTPGSENAVRLAMKKLILPELGHLVKELTK